MAEVIIFYTPPKHKAPKYVPEGMRGRLLLFMPRDYNVFIEIMDRLNSFRKLAT